ncbi:hypothetical protein CDAR_176541, partial [Caerostris darwini]
NLNLLIYVLDKPWKLFVFYNINHDH